MNSMSSLFFECPLPLRSRLLDRLLRLFKFSQLLATILEKINRTHHWCAASAMRRSSQKLRSSPRRKDNFCNLSRQGLVNCLSERVGALVQTIRLKTPVAHDIAQSRPFIDTYYRFRRSGNGVADKSLGVCGRPVTLANAVLSGNRFRASLFKSVLNEDDSKCACYGAEGRDCLRQRQPISPVERIHA